jgi:hypothetical protein
MKIDNEQIAKLRAVCANRFTDPEAFVIAAREAVPALLDFVDEVAERYAEADYVFMLLRQYIGRDAGKLTYSQMICRLVDDAESKG